ncbi:MAG: hypothetical protein WAX14_15225 [Rhodococcus sp. (in: high G+C Gram-positive bacteria)]|uniref:hypothetical protein n=1 Tax=Rhodococcus sp. TaxID=1831 RepID=UPI003BB628AD
MTESAETSEFTELPEADRIEQAAAVFDDDADDDALPVQVPLEVDAGDALEQSRTVPEDEDYPRG